MIFVELICSSNTVFTNQKSINEFLEAAFMRAFYHHFLQETSLISINEVRTTDGACYLELKIPSRSVREGFWNFLEKYGFRYGRSYSRALLPSEVELCISFI